MTAPSTLHRIPRPEPAPPVAVAAEKTLWCDVCGTWTKHARARVKGQSLYVCGCGTEIIHIVVMKIVEKGT